MTSHLPVHSPAVRAVRRPMHRAAAGLGGLALLAMLGLTAACSGSEQAPGTSTPAPAPSTTAPSTPSSTPAPSVPSSEKSIDPTGGNLFTPRVKAPAAPTAIPGHE